MKGVNGFTFFKNYYDAINDPENGLTEEEQGKLYNAIFAYMFEGKEPSLKGVCRLAFNLIKPSLDKSRQNGINRSKVEESAISESETNGNEMEQNGNEMEKETNEMESEIRHSKNKKEEIEQEREYKNKNKKNEQEREEGAGGGENPLSASENTERSFVQEKFFKEHPEIEVDNYPACLASEIDFEVLSAEISKSEYLRGTRSFAWICKNYRKIALGQYRDYAKSAFRGKGTVVEDKRAKSTKEELDAAFEE